MKIIHKMHLPPYLRNIAPALAFALGLCLLVICCYQPGYSSLPPSEKRYTQARANIDALKRDAKKNMQRDSWEKLAREFQSIYDDDPAWPNRPAALFRAAETLEELAKRSCNRADIRKAINCYENLALRHAESRLADDALFRAAQLRAAQLKDDKGALALIGRIKKQYAKGDMLPQAAALEKALNASAKGRTAPGSVKQVIERQDQLPVDTAPVEKFSKHPNFYGDLPLRLKAAKSRMDKLKNDGTRQCWRQPWEELRDEFLKIHKSGQKNLAPEAIFQAARCEEQIYVCSRLAADAKKAIEAYKKVPSGYPASAFAASAMLAHARLEYAQAPDKRKSAVTTLRQLVAKYPKSDKTAEAKRLLAIWTDAGTAEKSPKNVELRKRPELQVLSWDSINKNNVEVVLELSSPVKYTVQTQKAANGKPAALIIDLENASVANDIRNGVKVNGSLLKAIRVTKKENDGYRLQFDLGQLKTYVCKDEKNPSRIVLNIYSGKSAPVAGKTMQALLARPSAKKSMAAAASSVQDMASQLGLTVSRIFIDAGHGGKDPGTSHNKVIERDITLDIALALGKLLKANGMEVIYSRTSNKAVPLSERTRLANAAHADLFVSVHVNANDNSSANGLETYYLDLASNQQAARVAMLENSSSDRRLGDMQAMLAQIMLHARASESKRLASDIQRLALFRLKKQSYNTRSNGVKSAPFHVLLGAKMPAVLVEVGYCSNPAEAKNLSSPQYRQAIASGLAEGIIAYKERLLMNRTANLTGKRKS